MLQLKCLILPKVQITQQDNRHSILNIQAFSLQEGLAALLYRMSNHSLKRLTPEVNIQCLIFILLLVCTPELLRVPTSSGRLQAAACQTGKRDELVVKVHLA
ncbi:hypothetical protein ILYODFUR_019185 [Ilyodon furcidens]|uniref:Uncharacterized protein n=1 Tax=Ilyodon furcidens TaxID=33524 RepID=A0ABV0U6M8_9TELE